MKRYVYWQEDRFWLGYFEEFPDYMTQGESLDDLKEHLRDLHEEIVSDFGRAAGPSRPANLASSPSIL